MKKVYIGGSLFKQADIKQRLYEEGYVKKQSNNLWSVYNPINADINDKSLLPTAKSIFIGDLNEIISSDAILAALDDNDPGLNAEIGICYGINYVLEKLDALLKQDDISKTSIQNLINQIKPKKVYAHLSDIRVPTAHKYSGNYVPYGYNQFVIGAIEEMGEIHSTAESAIDQMLKDIK